MISYNNWKLLQESFGFTLGVSSTPKVASVGNLSGLDLEEAKMKKKMLEDDAEENEDDENDDGEEGAEADGDDVENKDKEADPEMCKSMKKKMKAEGCDDDDDDDDDDDEDETDADVEDAEEKTGMDLDGDDEEGEDPDHVAKVKGKTTEMPMSLGMKKKMKKKMKKEQVEEIKQMINPEVKVRNWDGISVKTEDMLIHSPDKNPGPGEVGYAPETRFGAGSIAEWKKVFNGMKKQ
jgi:hypothetical protein